MPISPPFLRRAALATACFSATAPTLAHDLSQDPLPATPGWRIGAAAAVTSMSASERLPAARHPGLPGSGQTAADRSGPGLEHATLEAALAFGQRHGAVLAIGKHGSDRVHTEAARLDSRWQIGLDRLSVQLGRDRVPMGPVLTGAGHFDRYALAPLAKRLVLNDDWISDGLNLRWERGVAEGLQSIDAGLWRARTWPGGLDGRLAPAVHLGGSWGDWNLSGFAASLAPRARGTPSAAADVPHTHGQPDCRRSLAAVACFDGQTRLLGGSLMWDGHDSGWIVTAAGLLQRDRGTLAAQLGVTDYRGTTRAGWLDVQRLLGQGWIVGLRAERASATHRLVGPGATLVSADAGLDGNHPITRLASALTWEPGGGWLLGLEAGTERSALPTNRWIGLRAAWSAPELLRGDW